MNYVKWLKIISDRKVTDPRAEKAFSLVELSIVIVILGLLVGGILSGKSLIHSAEIRSITTDYQRFATAINVFRDKYFQLPGDINNAEMIWGTLHPTNSTCRDSESTSPLTCNGDGNGLIESNPTLRSYESFRAWQHLANAGLIEGTYTGSWNPADSANRLMLTTKNGPRSKYKNGVYAIMPSNYAAGNFAYVYPPSTPHYVLLNPAGLPGVCGLCSLLTPEEAWNMDTKLDDGLPASGRVTGTSYGSCTVNSAGTITYKLSDPDTGCSYFYGF